MTTHIFLARGLWDDVVEANIRADAVSDRNLAARDLPPTFCGHYNEWLMYGYQQQGRYADADALLMGCFAQTHDERLPSGMRQSATRSYAYMRSLNLADTRAWAGEPAMSEADVGNSRVVAQLMQAWGSGVAALNRGDRSVAEQRYAFLKERGSNAEDEWESPYVPVWEGTLNAMLLADAGDADAALLAAQNAADYEASLPVDFGPPIAFKPARELEGEILLAHGRSEQALMAFQMALARTPNRILSLAGYARAAVAAGRADLAGNAYRALGRLLAGADSGLTEANEAKAFQPN